MRRITVWLFAGILLCACESKQSTEKKTAYKTINIVLSDQTLETDYAARLTGKQIVEIRPQVSGIITRICIKEGEAVRKGQTLFVIDQVPYQAALKVATANVRSAEAKLATAKLNMESSEELNKKNVVSDFQLKTSGNALLEAEANLEQARAQEVNARNNLSYTEVKSPVNGSAGMIPYHVGALVSSSIQEPLVTVSDDSEVYAYFSITENQAIDMMQQYGSMEKFIKQAPPVKLKMSNGSLYPTEGHVDAMSGIVDQSTGAVTLRATFDNTTHLLRNGGSGNIILPTRLDSCIIIPQSATYELQDRIFTYRVVDGKTQSTPISVYRLNNGTQYVVQSGLKVGDVIIAEGAGLLKDGIDIKQ